MAVAVARATAVIAPLRHETRNTYKTAVFEALYELIQQLELPPGERLTETDLAARFGVSKTPIREALLLLEKEKLVTIVPHAGATVTWLAVEDYEQQLFIQDALEQPALPLVVERITPDGLERCAHLAAAIRTAYARRDARLYQQLVIRLHTELFTTARYPLLTELIGTVQRSLRRYHPVFVTPFEDNWERELSIVTQRLEHVRDGDAAAAAAAVQCGHTAMLAFARGRVEARDPAVLRHVVPDHGGFDRL